jgi:hypothetical protein
VRHRLTKPSAAFVNSSSLDGQCLLLSWILSRTLFTPFPEVGFTDLGPTAIPPSSLPFVSRSQERRLSSVGKPG